MTLYTGLLRTSLETKFFRFCCIRTLHTTDIDISNFPSVSEITSYANKKECIKRLKSINLSPRELTKENRKRAAVLVPLCIVDEELSLLYTLRRANLKRHKGQVSFPGGVEDATDTTLEETALRETEEELGIDRTSVQIWGSGSIVVGNEFCVLPVVGYLGPLQIEKLTPSPDEVEVAFAISLRHLCDQKNYRYTQFRVGQKSGYVLPVYINSQFRVWGITSLITHIFLSSLLPGYYKNKLQYIKPTLLSQPVL